jgi:hypothetical protein
MNNLELYNKVRTVPEEAKKPILGGRLKGKTDINPVWRIKALTEQFGPCGTGWKTIIKEKRLENGANGEISAFVDIDLFVRFPDGWSEAIPGTGGSMFVEKETSGLHTNDECFKMAYTDAISVACKALGFGADVYWEKDANKYDKEPKPAKPKPEPELYTCAGCGNLFKDTTYKGKTYTAKEMYDGAIKKYGKALCSVCGAKYLDGMKQIDDANKGFDKVLGGHK